MSKDFLILGTLEFEKITRNFKDYLHFHLFYSEFIY